MHARGSYFASPPPSPSGSVPRSPGRASYFSTTPISSTPVYDGGMRSPMTISAFPTAASPLASPRLNGQLDSPRQSPSRRPTLTSAIPIGYHKHIDKDVVHPQHMAVAVASGEVGRRRPSFKIDLPPRPAPIDILSNDPATHAGPAGYTPYAVEVNEAHSRETKVTPLEERGAGRKLSLGALDMTDIRHEIDSIAYQAHVTPSSPVVGLRSSMRRPSFRDPFGPLASTPHPPMPTHTEDSYMILRGPSEDVDGYRPVESPALAHDDPMINGAGLGYSLNRLRAPTPWARRYEDEGEWLTSEDISKLRV